MMGGAASLPFGRPGRADQAVPVGAPRDVAAAPAGVPLVRNLINSRQGFSRVVVVESPRFDGFYLNVESLQRVQPHIRHMLTLQLRFLVKVVAQVRLAETVRDEAGEEREVYSEVWVPLGPWPVPPLANADERFRRYVLRETESRLTFALQESLYLESSRKRVVGVLTLKLLAGPAALTSNIPAPAGLPAAGGCYKDLPEYLRSGKQGIWTPKNQ